MQKRSFIHSAFLKLVVTSFILVHLFSGANAQSPDSSSFHPKRAWLIGSSGAVIAGGTLAGLSQVWYREEPMEAFHLFDDNNSWLQMDKVGHTMTAYYMGNMGMKAMQWTGTERKKAIWMGGLYGFAYLSAIEVLDGFSSEWGFSVGDMTANAAGSALAISEQLLWHEQRIFLKYSAQFTDYAQYRPAVLGSSAMERLLKDYNGQTYWLSVNVASWFREKPNWMPSWINIAAGYGVDGLTGGEANIAFDDNGLAVPHFRRQRQYYLSLDLDLTRIPTRSKVLRTCFDLLSFVKFPAPAIEFNGKGPTQWHWIYF